MRTVKEIARILNVKPNIAYGLLQFMREKGFVIEGKSKRPTGQRGKAAAIYSFDHTSIERLSKDLSVLVEQDRKEFADKAKLVAPINPAPAPVV